MQGERTIYSVDCKSGQWQGLHCTGNLLPADRYAFRASKRRNEVIYWIRDSEKPSGKYTDCTVVDRDNWSCNVHLNQAPTIAYEMADGRPKRGAQGLALPFRDVPKWKWWLLRLGVDLFSNASD